MTDEPEAFDPIDLPVDAEPDSPTELQDELPLVQTEGIDEGEPSAVPESTETAIAALKAADADAESDLARPSRVNQFRADRRARASMAIFGLLMIAVGGLYLAQVAFPSMNAGTLLGIGVLALGLGITARFLINGRRERGLFVVGVLLLAWSGLGALVSINLLTVEQAWPMGIMAIGLAMLSTFLLERSHERGLIFPALGVLAIGITALPITLNPASPDIRNLLTTFWPLLLLIGALALLPRAVRPRAE